MSKAAEKQKQFRERMKAKGFRRITTWIKEIAIVPTVNEISVIENVTRENCSICGRKTDNLEIHHGTYGKPLEFITVCKQCHIIADERRKNQEGGL